jgi:hypothetical protein
MSMNMNNHTDPARPKSTRVYLNRKEEHQIIEILRQTILRDGEFVKYVEGWSDTRVVQECGVARATINHVIAIRSELFGNLHRAGGNRISRYAALEGRVAALENLIMVLIK